MLPPPPVVYAKEWKHVHKDGENFQGAFSKTVQKEGEVGCGEILLQQQSL